VKKKYLQEDFFRSLFSRANKSIELNGALAPGLAALVLNQLCQQPGPFARMAFCVNSKSGSRASQARKLFAYNSPPVLHNSNN
jgi:hypothetical protein